MCSYIKKYKIGDVICIPLRKDLFVFARIFNDSSIGIYELLSDHVLDVKEIISSKIVFYPGVFNTAISSGEWQIIGHIPFKNDQDWPPPKYIKDVVNPDKYRIYFKGELRDASKEEIEGLEEQKMYKPDQLVKIIAEYFLNVK